MAMKTYQGSCQCKKVRFEADLDLAGAGTRKCNCTSCWKRRWWGAYTLPPAFRLLSGAEQLSSGAAGGFCRECGITAYKTYNSASWGGPGDEVAIAVSALDELDPAELLAGPVQYCDGLNNDWFHTPAETRHL